MTPNSANLEADLPLTKKITPKQKISKRGRPGYNQESMLEVIVEVFTTHGYDASSLEVIAKHLGLSKSAVYHHFSSKEEMLELALEQALGALENIFDEAEASTLDAASRIRTIITRAVHVASTKRQYLTLLLRLHGNTAVEQRALERRRALTSRLVNIFEEARLEGTLRNDLDPWLAARYSFGIVNSLVEWYQPDGQISPEDLAESVLLFVRTGLGVRS